MHNVIAKKKSIFFYRNIFHYFPKNLSNITQKLQIRTKNNSSVNFIKKKSRIFLLKKSKKHNFRGNYLLQKKNYYAFKKYKSHYLNLEKRNYDAQSQYPMYRSFYNFKFNKSLLFYETHSDIKKKKKILVNSINNFKIIGLNDFFFKNTLFNFIFKESQSFFFKFNVQKEGYFFLLSKNLRFIINSHLISFNSNFTNLKSSKFLFNFLYKTLPLNNPQSQIIFDKFLSKNLNKLIFFNKTFLNSNLQQPTFLSSKFFLKSPSFKLPLDSAEILYYFISHPFHSKSVMLKKKSKLTAHPMEDFNSSTREAFTYCLNVSFNKKIDGEDSIFKHFRSKNKFFFLNKSSLFLTSIKNSKTRMSFNKLPNVIANFFFFLGRKEVTVPKLRYVEFSKSIFKLKKKKVNLNFAFTSCFFFNAFLFSSIFLRKKRLIKKQRFFKIKKSYYFQPSFDNFLTNEFLEKFKKEQHVSSKKHYFKNNIFNIKTIQTYGLFLSIKEVFFFIFSKPLFFKFFFWNFKNTYKKNFLYYNSISFYFENLYKSFFQLNKNFKHSNVVPYGTCFLFKYKRVVQKDFSVQIFNPALTSFFYANVATFLEYCSGKKIMLNTNSFLITYLDFDERANCALWTPRIRIFRKMLGPRLFLNESLTILYICIKLKDPYLLSSWMLNMFYKISFWKYKLLFRYLYYVLKYFMWASFANKCIKGLRFQLKGKVSVAGNARTRTVFTSIGATGNGNLNKRVLTNLNLLRTFTGVIGFRTWLSF